jgi:hypothetical protein
MAAEAPHDAEDGGLARRTRARLVLGDEFDFNKADEELGMVVQQLEDDNKTQVRVGTVQCGVTHCKALRCSYSSCSLPPPPPLHPPPTFSSPHPAVPGQH